MLPCVRSTHSLVLKPPERCKFWHHIPVTPGQTRPHDAVGLERETHTRHANPDNSRRNRRLIAHSRGDRLRILSAPFSAEPVHDNKVSGARSRSSGLVVVVIVAGADGKTRTSTRYNDCLTAVRARNARAGAIDAATHAQTRHDPVPFRSCSRAHVSQQLASKRGQAPVNRGVRTACVDLPRTWQSVPSASVHTPSIGGNVSERNGKWEPLNSI
jgi:hypothetical protein